MYSRRPTYIPRLLPLATFTATLLGAVPVAADDGSVRVLFVGDIMLDGGPGHIITNGGDSFAPVASVLTEAALTVGNLECAIVKSGRAVDKGYTFRGPTAAGWPSPSPPWASAAIC